MADNRIKTDETQVTSDEVSELNVDSSDSKQDKSKHKKEKPLRGRRRLYADYRYSEVKNKHGKSVRRKVYQGKHYGYVIPKAYKKDISAFIRKIKLTYAAFFIAGLLVWVLPSFAIKSQALGNVIDKIEVNYAFVLIPYLVCTLPLMLMFLTLTEFAFTKGNKHEQAFMESLTKNLRSQTVMLMICAAITAVGQIVFIVTNYRVIVSAATEVALVAFMASLAGLCFFWLRNQEKFPMQEL